MTVFHTNICFADVAVSRFASQIGTYNNDPRFALEAEAVCKTTFVSLTVSFGCVLEKKVSQDTKDKGTCNARYRNRSEVERKSADTGDKYN